MESMRDIDRAMEREIAKGFYSVKQKALEQHVTHTRKADNALFFF